MPFDIAEVREAPDADAGISMERANLSAALLLLAAKVLALAPIRSGPHTS